MKLPDAYILMRVCFPTKGKIQMRRRLRAALASAAENMAQYRRAGGRAWMLINDDTGAAPGLLAGVLEYAGLQREQYVITRTQGLGSAFAMHRLRSEFLYQTERHPEAFAMILDQDDRLMYGALLSVGKKMKPFGLVLTPFSVEDPRNLDILGDGGRRHNRITRRISAGNVFRDDLPALSSIAWTKAYSREILKRYHEDLCRFLDRERGGAEVFFSKRRAYDDFIDFYSLLFTDVRLAGVYMPTHVYVKHEDAITNRPRVEDFRTDRVETLLALVDMCFANRDSVLHDGGRKISEDFRELLRAYIVIKLSNVQTVISKYKVCGEKYGCLSEVAEEDNYIVRRIVEVAMDSGATGEAGYAASGEAQAGRNLRELFLGARPDGSKEELCGIIAEMVENVKRLYTF